jgi:hypothetical protein
MLHACWSDIAAIEKIMLVTVIPSFSTAIRDATTHPPPCFSPFIEDNATILDMQQYGKTTMLDMQKI